MSLVTVARFVDPPTAHLARGLLEANGIQAFVFNEHYVGMDWLHSQAIGGVELRVAREQAEQARALIADPPRMPEPRFDALEPAAGDRAACPSCGSTAVRPDRLDHRLRALSLALGVPLATGRFRYRCGSCGHGWRSLPPHRGLRARLVDGVVLTLSILVSVLRLPWRLLAGCLGHAPPRRLECWACGTPFREGDKRCAACGVVHPPAKAFERMIELGRAYDATCAECHTPFVRAERDGEACPICGAPASA
jgi:hypothetical protein